MKLVEPRTAFRFPVAHPVVFRVVSLPLRDLLWVVVLHVFAVTSSRENATYASNAVSIVTAEGGKDLHQRIQLARLHHQ